MAQISYIKYTDVLEARRYDAEYFKPEYLEIDKKIASHDFNVLQKITHKIDVGFVGSMTKEYCEEGILLLQTKNIEEFSLNLSQTTFINEKFHKKLKKSQVNYGDILIARSGSFGKASIYMEKEVCNSSDIIIVEGDNGLINNFYLVAFLNSKFGVGQLMKFASGGLQGHVNLTILESLKISLLPQSFQLQIEEIVKSAHQKQTQSKQLYREAEQLLLQELGLLNYQVKHSLTFTTTKKEVEEAHRYDSEYFQPKYAEIIKKIEGYEGGWDLVKNQFKQNTTLSKKDGDYCNYIEISDVNVSNGEITPNRVEIKDIPANGKRKLFKNDLLISKVRPYRGAISFIDFEVDNLIGSGAFTVLQEKTGYKKEVLMIFLKTVFIKELLLRYNCGTSYPVIKDEDILNLQIPLIKPSIQKQIAEKIQESHRLRKESKELLDEAKRKVEEEIEKE